MVLTSLTFGSSGISRNAPSESPASDSLLATLRGLLAIDGLSAGRVTVTDRFP